MQVILKSKRTCTVAANENHKDIDDFLFCDKKQAEFRI